MATGTALVNGAQPRVQKVAEALQSEGFDPVEVAVDNDELREVVARLGNDSVACYVQLPGNIRARGRTVIERVRNFLVDGLISRFEAAELVTPALAPHAVALLVSGNHPEETDAPDNHPARLSLLDTLAACLMIERPGDGLRPVVLRSDRTDVEVTGFATDPGRERSTAFAELADRSADLSFDEWRQELLDLVHTYS